MIEELKNTPIEIALQARIAALEQQLIEQQQATSRLLDASREGLWDFELKPDGAYFISPRTAELLGYTISGLPIPFDFRRHVYPEDWPTVRDELTAALKGLKEYAEADFRAVKPNGETTWVRIRGITVPQRSERDAHLAGRPVRLIGSVLDISRERLAEQNLAAQKQLFANVFSVLPVAAFIADANRNILEVNPAWEALMQAVSGSAVGTNISTFGLQAPAIAASTEPLQREPAIDSSLNSIHAKPTLQWQTVATTATGERVSVMIRKAQLYAASGEVIGTIGVITDLTARELAQRELMREREQLSLVVKSSGAGLFTWSQADGNLHLSNRARDMLGWNNGAQSIRPSGFMQAVHADDENETRKKISSAFSTCSLFEQELRLRCGNGQYRWYLACGQFTAETADEPMRYIGSLLDITERKNAVASLALERQNLQLVLNASNIATYSRDYINDTVYVSPEFTAMFGYTSADFAHATTMIDTMIHPEDQLIHPDDRVHVHVHREKFAGSDDVSTLITRARHIDGHYIWIESYVKRLRDKSGKIIRSVGALRDISEQKQRELQLLEANQRAEAATKIKSEFLATMSHEIRTPLNGVIGAANLLAETKLAPEQREYVNAVRLSGDTLLALLGDVLDLSKIESGAFDLDEAPISLLRLVDEAAEILGERARAKRVNIIVTVADDIPSTLKGDAVRVRQVVLNLLSNAIKFTTLGDITVTVALEHQFATNHCEIRFSVTDTGIGMSEEVLARIFTPFTQADSSTSRRFGGTGLGLAICKGLVERMGGKITVTSKEGVGSTFSALLPFVMDERNAVENVTIRMFSIPFLNKRVMLVEPHETLRAAISARLKRLSIVVEACASGTEAIELLNNGSQAHAIITEIHLPDMDAGAFAFAVRRITGSNGRPIKLVALTNTSRYQMERDAATRLREFDAYLLKPARDAQLAEALASVWGVRAHHDASDNNAALGVGSGPPQRLKVLIVDDNQINQMLSKQTLLRLGHEVALAENGEDAVAQVNKHASSQPFDLILMDLQMPIMDGFEAAALITAQQPENRRPTIVALSANVSENDRVRAAASGMVEFLSKPLSQDRLRYVLRSVLNKDARLKGQLLSSSTNTQDSVAHTVVTAVAPIAPTVPVIRASESAAITARAFVPSALNIPVGPNASTRRFDDVSTQPLKIAAATTFERTAPLPIVNSAIPFTPQNTTERLRAFTPEQLALDPEQLEEIAFIAQHGEPSALATIVENLATVSTEALTVFTSYGSDLTVLSKAAHRVGGAYATVGAKQAHAAFKALENAARGNAVAEIPKLLQDALEKREIAHRAFLAWYANIVPKEK